MIEKSACTVNGKISAINYIGRDTGYEAGVFPFGRGMHVTEKLRKGAWENGLNGKV